jgi:NDP-sugar pyrophosphorylase family protein
MFTRNSTMANATIFAMPEAVVLCGGAGLRLRSVTGTTPKSLAAIADRPFLEVLLRQLRRHGVRRVVLAVGYQGETIQKHLGERALGLELAYSTESSPLGTGGAVANALSLIESESSMVLNGDSYTGVDMKSFAAEHQESGADGSIVIVPLAGRTDCGSVVVDQDGTIVEFEEKQSHSTSPYANAGIYILNRKLFRDVPIATQVSLERELLPQWVAERKHLKAFVHDGPCIDIGTPERYQKAQQMLAEVEGESAPIAAVK